LSNARPSLSNAKEIPRLGVEAALGGRPLPVASPEHALARPLFAAWSSAIFGMFTIA
jgi:hypothetical protein